MKTILLTGANGQVGKEIQIHAPHDVMLISLDKKNLDIISKEAIRSVFSKHNPDYIINAAAYTAVDKAETEPELAFAVNSIGPQNLAESCKKNNIPLIHISTDYVFDGTSKVPYKEDDPVSPLGVYGKSKFEGEQAVRQILNQHIILRTSWVFSLHGHNFVKTMLRLFKERETVKVVDDQIGCPTAASDIAKCIWQIINATKQTWGTYHFCGKKSQSWYEFALDIYDNYKNFNDFIVKNIVPIKTIEYPVLAKRPKFSVLNQDKFNYYFKLIVADKSRLY